jgi:hypothetical protein|tara:strand:+ start:231 stop:419 length:189 start_codon:yes stop_codon:yes gene_type:complete
MIDFKDTSTVYQYYKSELEQIQKHKWIESEKAGKDVGFSFALTDWIRYHRKAWRKSIKKPHQ